MASNRYCCVPFCKSSKEKNPEKIFFSMPQDPVLRKKWLSVMRRDLISDKSHVSVCEDHFDLENDMENYMRFKFQGGRALIKKDVVPSDFSCQKPARALAPVYRSERALKRRRTVKSLRFVMPVPMLDGPNYI